MLGQFDMRRFGAVILLGAALVLGLAACDTSDDDDDDDGGGGGSEIQVINITGDSVSVEGTWFGCSDDDGTDYGTQYVFAGLAVTITTTTYSSTELTCDAGDTPEEDFDVDAEAVGDEELTGGWTNGAEIVDAPDALDGETTITDPPTATIIELTSGGEVGGRLVLLMDDTGETPILFRGHDAPSPDCDMTEEEPWEHCLITVDTMEKQD